MTIEYIANNIDKMSVKIDDVVLNLLVTNEKKLIVKLKVVKLTINHLKISSSKVMAMPFNDSHI